MFHTNEQRLARQLTATGMPGLFDILQKLKHISLNEQYTLRWLYAVGGQSIVLLAEQQNKPMVIVKLPFLPYHRLAYISLANIQQARQHLIREARLLQQVQTSLLPTFYDLIYAPNPLHAPQRGAELINQEPYLVMEFIPGKNLLDITRAMHRDHARRYDLLEKLAWHVTIVATTFFTALLNGEERLLYVDFKSVNIRLTAIGDRPIRILDAGSLVPMQPEPDVPTPITLAYAPPDFYAAYERGEPLWPTIDYVMYTLGKTLWELLTNRQPYPGEEPDLSEPALTPYSPELRTLIQALLTRTYESFGQVSNIAAAYTDANPLSQHEINILISEKNMEEPVSPQVHILSPVSLHKKNSLEQGLTKIAEVYLNQSTAILKYTHDGKYLAVADRNQIRMLDPGNFCPARTLHYPRPFDAIIDFDLDNMGRYMAVGGTHNVPSLEGDGVIYVWGSSMTSDRPLVHVQKKLVQMSGQVALSGQTEMLVSTNKWGAVIVQLPLGIFLERHIGSIIDSCSCLALDQESSILAIGGSFGGIRLWNLKTLAIYGDIPFKSCVFRIVIHSRHNKIIALVGERVPEIIMVWDLKTSRLLYQQAVPDLDIIDMKVDITRTLLALACRQGSLRLWALNEKEMVQSRQLNVVGTIASFDFAPDGQTLAIATAHGADSTISTYQLDL